MVPFPPQCGLARPLENSAGTLALPCLLTFVLFSHIYPWQVFPREVMNFTAENIYKWASENQETLFRWLQPHGGKSLLLNNELKKGPALFLFIPFDPLAESHPLLDEVGVLVVVSWLFFHIRGTNLSSEWSSGIGAMAQWSLFMTGIPPDSLTVFICCSGQG